MHRVGRRIVAYRTLVVRVNPFPLKPGQGVYFFKFVQPLFVGDVNHLDPADAGIGRDWSEPGMALWRGPRGGPHANLGGRVLIAEHGKHEFQGRHAARGNRGPSGGGRPVRRAYLC